MIYLNEPEETMDKITYQIDENYTKYSAVSKLEIEFEPDITVDKWCDILKHITEIKGFVWDSVAENISEDYQIEQAINRVK